MLCGLGLEKFPQSFLLINSWAIHFSDDKCFSLGIEATACLLKYISFFLRYIENLFPFLSLILNLRILCKNVFGFFFPLLIKLKREKRKYLNKEECYQDSSTCTCMWTFKPAVYSGGEIPGALSNSLWLVSHTNMLCYILSVLWVMWCNLSPEAREEKGFIWEFEHVEQDP